MDIAGMTPINKLAAIVSGRGEHHSAIIKSSEVYSQAPIPTKEMTNNGVANHTGARFGRLVVIGLSSVSKGWVCRCDCGYYTIRKHRSITNPLNQHDRCKSCMALSRMKKKDYRRRTGKDLGVENF